MYAVVGIPGSRFHTHRHFARGERGLAEEWLDVTARAIRERNPALGTLPTQLISDREAGRVRYQDGTRVYTWDQDAARDEERAAAYGGEQRPY